VANQARADVCSTPAHGACAWATRTQCLVVCSLRRKPRDAARFDGGFDLLRSHCRNSHGLFGAGGASVPEPGAVVMFGVGVVLLRLFTGYAGASIEAHANASDPPMGVTGSIRLREHRCAPSWSLRETLAAGAMLFPLRSGFIGSDVSSQGVDKAYNRAIFRWPGSQ